MINYKIANIFKKNQTCKKNYSHSKKDTDPYDISTMEWDQFERAKSILKMLQVSWAESILIKGPRSFQRGSLSFCRSKGVKVGDFEKNSVAQPQSNHMRASQVRVPGTLHLQPFSIQKVTVPLWKDLDLVINISSVQDTDSI